MPPDERSRAARQAAERALIRVVHHYGSRPEFVVLGGLVPELLCSASEFQHAGTTDIDVQVDLEIACGSVNTARPEQALRNAEFEPDNERIWRWRADGPHSKTIVKLAGFLLAKCAAANSRRKRKDWYDIAFVLLHNDAGGPVDAANAALARFGADLPGVTTALDDLRANFAMPAAQGARPTRNRWSSITRRLIEQRCWPTLSLQWPTSTSGSSEREATNGRGVRRGGWGTPLG